MGPQTREKGGHEMKTRREFIIEQAAALQVAAISRERIYGEPAHQHSRLCVDWATALADALELVDEPEPRDTPLMSDTIEDYRVPRAVGDAWIRDRDFVGVGTWHRPLYDCLKAQQQENK